ncbi:MAG: TIGR01777 family oxidoreductase [Bacteroidales bacterium]|nr:TIGR01777 family oxidoreductase [Bacteroidales bacterium]
MKNIIITGGSGLVGMHLSEKLRKKGYNVFVFSRSKKNVSESTSYWDYKNNIINKDILQKANYIVHLAGVNISSKRWTTHRKKDIVESRVKTAEFLLNSIDQANNSLESFISASAVGYYGAVTSNNIFTEEDNSASDFLGVTCKEWEQTVDKFKALGIRTVKLRTGIVLAKEGGALPKMIPPIKLGIGSAIGSGKQYMPWIHIDDLCDIYIKAIEDENMQGVYNAIAPEYVNNFEFTRSLAKVLKKPFWFPQLPSVLMKLLFGEMANILLKGSRVSSEKILKSGFEFKYRNLKDALQSLNLC